MAVAGLQVHFTLEIRQPDGTVSGMEIDFSFPRHMNFNLDSVAVYVEAEHMNVVREMDFQLDRVPGLVFFDPEAMLANLVALRSHASFNGFLVPGIHMNVGVGGFHTEVGSSRNRVSFR